MEADWILKEKEMSGKIWTLAMSLNKDKQKVEKEQHKMD